MYVHVRRSTRERLLLRGPQTEPSILETENTLFRNRQVVLFFFFEEIENILEILKAYGSPT